jgi:hypothetical protein
MPATLEELAIAIGIPSSFALFVLLLDRSPVPLAGQDRAAPGCPVAERPDGHHAVPLEWSQDCPGRPWSTAALAHRPRASTGVPKSPREANEGDGERGGEQGKFRIIRR